jgi:hypothetical protein
VFGVAYLGFDVHIPWSALHAVYANPVPGYAVVVRAFIIGALSGGIAYMLIRRRLGPIRKL